MKHMEHATQIVKTRIINFKTAVLNSSICECRDANTVEKRTLTITGEEADANGRNADKRNKLLTFRNFAPFVDCISEINNIPTDNVRYLDVGMSMYNLI